MAIRLNPKDAVAFYHLGVVKKAQGQDGEAIDAYSMAAALKPDYAEAYVNLGKIAIDRGKYELGERSCRKALESNTNLAQPYVNLRSEEHTSDTTSLMRRQYADFCMNKQ